MLRVSSRLAGQYLDYRHILSCLVLYVGARDGTCGPQAYTVALYSRNHLPRLLMFLLIYMLRFVRARKRGKESVGF